MAKTEKRIEMAQLLGQLREGEEKPGETVLRALRHLAQSRGAETALLQLCINHGFAAAHSDTLADIIREIDAQIPQWQNLDRLIDVLEKAGCTKNGYVNAPEDVVANALRAWLRS